MPDIRPKPIPWRTALREIIEILHSGRRPPRTRALQLIQAVNAMKLAEELCEREGV